MSKCRSAHLQRVILCAYTFAYALGYMNSMCYVYVYVDTPPFTQISGR